MRKLLANRLNIGMDDEDIISQQAKETRRIIGDYNMSVQGFEMSWAIISSLVPRLGINNMNYDPSTLIRDLAIKNGGSYDKFCTEVKSMQSTLLNLNEDFRPHKLCKQFLE